MKEEKDLKNIKNKDISSLSKDEIYKLLEEPFDPLDLEWRILFATVYQNGEIGAECVPYVSARAIMRRLDSVVGFNNWQNFPERIKDGFVHRLSIRIDGEWISKTDAAEDTAVHPVKGGISTSLKRVAVLFGIGRYLYRIGTLSPIIGTDREKFPYTAKAKSNGGKRITFRWRPPTLPEYALPDELTPMRAEERAEIMQYYSKLTKEQKELIDKIIDTDRATRKWAWKIIKQIKTYLDEVADKENKEEQSKSENRASGEDINTSEQFGNNITNAIEDEIDDFFPED